MMHHLLSKIFKNIVWIVATNSNEIFLTFDDGPHPEYTPQILEILNTYQAHATFFIVGNKAEQYPHIVRQIDEQGHAIGLHSYSHPRLVGKSRQFILSELGKTQQVIEEIIQKPVMLFRPPYGNFTPLLLRICVQQQLKVILWTTASYDYFLRISNRRILQKIKNFAEPGTIHVFHDGHKNSFRTASILPEILEFYHSCSMKLSALPF
ncbi:polysaccharide deacetylase family protein [candidate division KSB1 bacterium]|nr:polysaccharide deacetylase family protein [candidate division KSB1 bacterium]